MDSTSSPDVFCDLMTDVTPPPRPRQTAVHKHRDIASFFGQTTELA